MVNPLVALALALACVSLVAQRHEETGTRLSVDKLQRCAAEGGHTLCSSCNVTVEEFAAGRATNSLQPDSEALVRHSWRKGQENCRAASRLVVNSFPGQCVGFKSMFGIFNMLTISVNREGRWGWGRGGG